MAQGQSVLATLVTTTVDFALSQGVALADIERATEVSGLALMDPSARLPDAVLHKIWALLRARDPARRLPLVMARAAPFSFFGDLVHGAQFAEHLRAAIELFQVNSRVIADRAEVQLVPDPEGLAITVTHPYDALDDSCTNQVSLALVSRMVREVLEIDNAIARAEFTFAEPVEGAEEHEAFFGAPVRFGQPLNSLVFCHDALNRRVSGANLELFRYVEQHFARLRARHEPEPAAPALAGLRRAVVEVAETGRFDVDTVARHLRLSRRSAQRLAREHGTTLTELINDVRIDMARSLLRDATLGIDRIALMLGYSDARALRRAFRRTTGLTPTEFRQKTVQRFV